VRRWRSLLSRGFTQQRGPGGESRRDHSGISHLGARWALGSGGMLPSVRLVNPAAISDLVKPIRHRWIAAGATPRAGATSEELKLFEAKYSVTLPSDVASFYQGVNGMPPNHMDDRMIRWWPVEEVQPATNVGHDELQYADFFVFADWSLDAHLYQLPIEPSLLLCEVEVVRLPVLEPVSQFVWVLVVRIDAGLQEADAAFIAGNATTVLFRERSRSVDQPALPRVITFHDFEERHFVHPVVAEVVDVDARLVPALAEVARELDIFRVWVWFSVVLVRDASDHGTLTISSKLEQVAVLPAACRLDHVMEVSEGRGLPNQELPPDWRLDLLEAHVEAQELRHPVTVERRPASSLSKAGSSIRPHAVFGPRLAGRGIQKWTDRRVSGRIGSGSHTVPRIASIGPYRFYFFANESGEPPHVHVDRDDAVSEVLAGPRGTRRQRGLSGPRDW
jgi:hypothetical protein